MSLLVSEVYEALVEAGASEQKAKAAAAAIPAGGDLATKQDILELRAEMAEHRAADRREAAEHRAADRLKMAEIEAKVDGLEARVNGVEAKVDELREFVKAFVFRFFLPVQLLIVGLLLRQAFFGD